MHGVWLSVDYDYFVPEDPLWDWGHKENDLFRFLLWPIRLSGLLAAGVDPREYAAAHKVAPKPHSFWSTLEMLGYKLSRRTNICVADSHSYAANFFLTVNQYNPVTLLHFDAHHDLGYRGKAVIDNLEQGRVACDDWHLALLHHCPNVIRSRTVYPEWRGVDEWVQSFEDTNWRKAIGPILQRVSAFAWEPSKLWQDEEVHVDNVFICRSSAWVPPYLDEDFVRFVRDLEKRSGEIAMTPFVDDERCDPLEPREFSWESVHGAATMLNAKTLQTCKTLSVPASAALGARVEQEVELEVPEGEDAA
jgi:hypothetical protein